jgi:hypothetical protein
VQFARLDRPELDIAVKAERFQLMNRRDFLKVAATGDLKLSGSPTEGGAVLAGHATVNEGTGYLDKFMRSSGIDLSDTLYAQFVDTTVLLEATGGRSFVESLMDSLRIDSVSVDLGDNFWLRVTRCVDSARGTDDGPHRERNARADGESEKYALVGTVRAVRGIYRMTFAPGVTREFTIREGTIRYFGSPRQDAILDLGADHVVRTATGDEVHITAHIGGTLEKPTVSLTSDVSPPLSETELISYLVFGAPTAQAFLGSEGNSQERSSVFEKSASQLVGVLSGKIESAVVSQLGLPIDYFRIKPGEVQSGLAGHRAGPRHAGPDPRLPVVPARQPAVLPPRAAAVARSHRHRSRDAPVAPVGSRDERRSTTVMRGSDVGDVGASLSVRDGSVLGETIGVRSWELGVGVAPQDPNS